MADPTVFAIDWSGAKAPRRNPAIWVARRDPSGEWDRGRWSRDEAVDHVIAADGPLFVGLDFCFGFPEWFARALGCTTIDEVWSAATTKGDEWLGSTPAPPFWRHRGTRPAEHRRFRRCETRYPTAKSVFQLVGNGQVGAGSVRGMPLLAHLRAAGFAIWPFDPPGERTVVEIYPTLLRKLAPHHDVGPWESNDQRDAVVSARVMWDERETVAALSAATDPVTRLEGDVWAPSSARRTTASP